MGDEKEKVLAVGEELNIDGIATIKFNGIKEKEVKGKKGEKVKVQCASFSITVTQNKTKNTIEVDAQAGSKFGISVGGNTRLVIKVVDVKGIQKEAENVTIRYHYELKKSVPV